MQRDPCQIPISYILYPHGFRKIPKIILHPISYIRICTWISKNESYILYPISVRISRIYKISLISISNILYPISYIISLKRSKQGKIWSIWDDSYIILKHVARSIAWYLFWTLVFTFWLQNFSFSISNLICLFSMFLKACELQWVALSYTCFTMFFEGLMALSCSELQAATQTPKCATQALEKHGLQLGWVAAELRWVAAELRLSCGWVAACKSLQIAACRSGWLQNRIKSQESK